MQISYSLTFCLCCTHEQNNKHLIHFEILKEGVTKPAVLHKKAALELQFVAKYPESVTYTQLPFPLTVISEPGSSLPKILMYVLSFS